MSHVVVAELVSDELSVEATAGHQGGRSDAVVVLDSMKLEIPVLADVAGMASEIVVTPGDMVRDGEPLVELETA